MHFQLLIVTFDERTNDGKARPTSRDSNPIRVKSRDECATKALQQTNANTGFVFCNRVDVANPANNQMNCYLTTRKPDERDQGALREDAQGLCDLFLRIEGEDTATTVLEECK